MIFDYPMSIGKVSQCTPIVWIFTANGNCGKFHTTIVVTIIPVINLKPDILFKICLPSTKRGNLLKHLYLLDNLTKVVTTVQFE